MSLEGELLERFRQLRRELAREGALQAGAVVDLCLGLGSRGTLRLGGLRGGQRVGAGNDGRRGCEREWVVFGDVVKVGKVDLTRSGVPVKQHLGQTCAKRGQRVGRGVGPLRWCSGVVRWCCGWMRGSVGGTNKLVAARRCKGSVRKEVFGDCEGVVTSRGGAEKNMVGLGGETGKAGETSETR